MLRIGVTGGIGGGKSLVCNILEKMGVPVYYADQEARRLMNGRPELREGISRLLGPEAYRAGELDRQRVASMVFADPVLLDELNKLVHPAVHEDFYEWTRLQEGKPVVAEEAALLFESGAYRMLDRNILVSAPEDLRLRRVMQRDGVGRQEVLQRMRRQMDEESKKELADEVILNDGHRLLLPQVVAVYNKLKNCKS